MITHIQSYSFGEDDTLADIVGEYIYLSLHFRGTYFHLRETGGFTFGKKDDICDNFHFHCDGEFRNDINAINGIDIQEIIDLLNDMPSINKAPFYKLLNIDNFEQYYNTTPIDKFEYDKPYRTDLEDCIYDCRKEFYEKYDIIKNADKIFYYDHKIVVIRNLNNVLSELNFIKNYVKTNNISQLFI